MQFGRGSRDCAARVVTAALTERDTIFTNELLAASAGELKRFGLGVAITALWPFNFLSSRLEDARREP